MARVKSLNVRTSSRSQMVNVTDEVQSAVREAGLRDGLVVCFVPHTTAAITIQENADPDVVHDILMKLEQLIPQRDPGFQHGEGNSDAHIKCSLLGMSQTIPVEAGRLLLGTWQGIYFCEFDGPRNRQLLVKCVSAE